MPETSSAELQLSRIIEELQAVASAFAPGAAAQRTSERLPATIFGDEWMASANLGSIQNILRRGAVAADPQNHPCSANQRFAFMSARPL